MRPIGFVEGINLFNYGSHKRNVYVCIMLCCILMGWELRELKIDDGAKVLSSTTAPATVSEELQSMKSQKVDHLWRKLKENELHHAGTIDSTIITWSVWRHSGEKMQHENLLTLSEGVLLIRVIKKSMSKFEEKRRERATQDERLQVEKRQTHIFYATPVPTQL